MTPSVGNFLLLTFPKQSGRTAADADAFLSARGFILRAVAAYGLSKSLRLTVGGEEADPRASSLRSPSSCEAEVIERLGEPLAEPIFEELAIIGVGLIGSSIARAARRRNAARRIVLADRSVEVLERAKALGLGDLVTDEISFAP